MARIIRLTESDLARIVRRVIREENTDFDPSAASGSDTNKCRSIIDPLVKKGWQFVNLNTYNNSGYVGKFSKMCSATNSKLYFTKGEGPSSGGTPSGAYYELFNKCKSIIDPILKKNEKWQYVSLEGYNKSNYAAKFSKFCEAAKTNVYFTKGF
jgi:hypothetical protein